MSTVNEYINKLRDDGVSEITVNSLSSYINAIKAISFLFAVKHYRGQADAKWDIASSAYRWLNPPAPTPYDMRKYHVGLLSDVSRLAEVEQKSELNMVAHLQHNGAPTFLVDYTRDPLVALWMACSKETPNNGAVYCFKSDSNDVSAVSEDEKMTALFDRKDGYFEFQPPLVNRRILVQQSVFLFTLSGIIEKDKHIVIAIGKNKKNAILQDLKLIGIHANVLFPDFHGFISSFDFGKKLTSSTTFSDLISNGDMLFDSLNYIDARKMYESAIEWGESNFPNENIELANVYQKASSVCEASGFYNDAMIYAKKALSIREAILGENHIDTATSYNNMAVVYNKMGNYSHALELYQKALEIRETVLGKQHPDTATTYNNIADVYNNMGDYSSALEWFQKALDIRESVLGTQHPDTATSYNDIACVYASMGDYPRALERYQKALEIKETVLGKQHPDIATIYNNIARVYKRMGDYPLALKCYQKALEIHETVLGKQHPDTASTYHNIADTYSSMGDYPRALEWYQKALEICEEVLGKEHPSTANIYNSMACVYANMSDNSRALELYQKALEVFETVLGSEHPLTKIVKVNIEAIRERQA